MLFALLLAVPLNIQLPSETFENRIQAAVLAAAAGHGHTTKIIIPRTIELPALSGTEGITLQAFRENLRAADSPYIGRQTAQEVMDYAASFRESLGAATEATLLAQGWGWLMLNSIHATLLGEQQEMLNYQIEAGKVMQALQADDEDDPSSLSDWFGTYSSFEAKPQALWLSAMLREQAGLLARSGASLTDSLDPEGYLRQQLRMVSDELTRVAEVIFDTAHAFTL